MVGMAVLAGCRTVEESPTVMKPTCDWTQSRWIGDGRPAVTDEAAFYQDRQAPCFRKTFTVDKPVTQARLYWVGLGYCDARVNDVALSETAFTPIWTPYAVRVLHEANDVTGLLRNGKNVITMELGNGWYNPLPLRMWGGLNIRKALAVGEPCLIARLEIDYADGTSEQVCSDTSWACALGPVVRNSIYLGEVYDARKELPGWRTPGYDDTFWKRAVVVEGPKGAVEPRGTVPAITVKAEGHPASVKQLENGDWVVDLGFAMSGVSSFALGQGASGEQIVFRYAEVLKADGSIDTRTTCCGQIKAGMAKGGPGAPETAEQHDTYIRCGGRDEVYCPRFTWHGYRYIQISGLKRELKPEDVTWRKMLSDLPSASTFECSNPLVNRIHAMCVRTFEANMMGVQSDCPARERFGYGGDIAATAESLIRTFDMHAQYAKFCRDFADEAEKDGWLTETAPYVGIGDSGFGGRSGPISWTYALPEMMGLLYRYYGDRTMIERYYPVCTRYLDQVAAACPDGICKPCIGDHEALEKLDNTESATAYYYAWARSVERFALLLGKKEDAAKYGTLAQTIRSAFRARYVKDGKVGKGLQSEQLYALYHGLLEPAERPVAFKTLTDNIAAHDQALTTGIFATKFFFREMYDANRDDLAGSVALRGKFPGWGHMLANDATTLWETWKISDNVYSRNHPMFGSVEEWIHRSVLGIEIPPDAVGCDKIIIDPRPVEGIDWAKGEYRTPHGTVKVSWRRNADGTLDVSADIPQGITRLPAKR